MTRFFDDFWLASELDAYNLPEFGQRITAFHGDDKPLRLDYPAAPVSLPQTRRSPLERVAARRRSGREFAERPLHPRELSRLLGSCRAWGVPSTAVSRRPGPRMLWSCSSSRGGLRRTWPTTTPSRTA